VVEYRRRLPRRGLSVGALILTVVLAVLTTAEVGAPRDVGAAADPEVRVGLIRAAGKTSVGAQGEALVSGPDGLALGRLNGETVVSSPGGQVLAVAGLGAFTGPIVVQAVGTDPAGPDAAADGPNAPGWVTVEGHPYRGRLEVFARDGLVTVVNVLPLEDYLLGVVPREMPSTFPLEALKAQAVAARTFALYTRASGAYAALGYDLVPTVACQVYGGVEAEKPPATEAVRATAGEVLTYGGRLIGAFFHSSSGGHTESAEYVWGFPRPYLKGVPDYDQASPYFTWTLILPTAEAEARLRQAGYDVGRLRAVEGVPPQGPGGRYLDRLVQGSAGEVRLRSEKLRDIWGLRSAWFDVTARGDRIEESTGPVNADTLSAVSAGPEVWDLTAEVVAVRGGQGLSLARAGGLWAVAAVVTPATLTFAGRGWGHGVGLSQWGARGMALEGKDYRQILTYYYNGVTVGTLP